MPFRIRLLALRRLGDAGYPLITAIAVTIVVQALLPAATALATAAAIGGLGHDGRRDTVLALVVLGATILFGQVLSAVLRPLMFLARSRVDGAHRERISAMAVTATTIGVLEQPRIQDLIKATSADPKSWVERTPADGALGQLLVAGRYLGLAASAAVLAQYALWLLPAVLLPALLVRVLLIRQWLNHFRIWSAGLGHHRYAAYWCELATAPAEGKELRVFGLGEWLIARQQSHVHEHMAPVWADDHRAARAKWLHALLTFVPLAAVFYLVGVGTAGGAADVALEAAVLTAAWSVFLTIGGAFETVAAIGSVPVYEAYERLRAELTTAAPASGARPAGPAEPRPDPPLVRFERVSFHYPGTDRLVLDRIDLELRPGELLAVVGLNGAGKSTLTKLLGGLYAPTSGRITADGIDIADPATGGIPAWRGRLAIVFQDFVKYQLSAADNVTLGAAVRADRTALVGAARDAGFDVVLDRLPDGWDTPLARARTGGVDLSGGQWQQAVLARALYAVRTGARILVLDEPTAHLDVRTELEVFARLTAVSEGASVVLISHRLSTVRQADRIVLLADGRIVESGSHAELMALGGRYAEMFAIQAERFTQGYDDQIEEGELR